MAKEKITLSIDAKVKKVAKKHINNISEFVELALREGLRDLAFDGKIDKDRYLKSCPLCDK